MDYILIFLRLLHIVFAVLWVGVGATFSLFILPSVRHSGENGMRYLKTLLQHSPFARVTPISGGFTILAGILLYIVSHAQDHFSDAGNRALGLGALVGILAGIHSGALAGRATRALAATLVEKVSNDNQNLSVNDLRLLQEYTAKAITQARINTLLTIIALAGMASARYL